ncbi:MAG: gamma-glutamyl-phosphate reductase, partial [Bartonella sp.]|nr:gamma-glutamyl-phosphate reductase [Bartonella sp.]
ARDVASILASASADQRKSALEMIALNLEAQSVEILCANRQDLENASRNSLTSAMVDWLKLDESRLHAMIDSVRQIACLPDSVGEVISEWMR